MYTYLWSKKAEEDYRRRHPSAREKDIRRKAGQEAKYDGKPVKGEVLRAFRMRGWIDTVRVRKGA